MKNVRLFYKKTGAARFISHLDTMRAMTRLLRRAALPVWYTEGFNPHLYVTFAMPLTLGFSSVYELADIRLTDDSFPLVDICERLNSHAPEGFYFFDAREPQNKLSALSFAAFSVTFDDGGALKERLENFLDSSEINVEKKTKRGDVKSINVAPDIKEYSIASDGGTKLDITLPAGPEKSINPELIINKFLSDTDPECFFSVTRTALLDKSGEPLK